MMRDLFVQAAGILGIVSAVVHGILAETTVFPRARIDPAWVKLLLRLVWQCSSVAWAGVGALLIAVPYLGSESARLWIIAVAVLVYGFGAIGNAWATKGRHYGWMMLTAASILAVVGH